MNRKYKIIALFGESGAGKDTIQKKLLEILPNSHGIISCTSRPKRDYEIDGKDYYFISKEKMQELINNNEMLETSIFNNWYYGTGKMSLDINKINIGVFNIQGLKSLNNRFDVDLCPIYVYARPVTRLLRVLTREESPDCHEICRRFLADEEEEIYDFINIRINNDTNDNLNNLLYDIYDCEEFYTILNNWSKELNNS